VGIEKPNTLFAFFATWREVSSFHAKAPSREGIIRLRTRASPFAKATEDWRSTNEDTKPPSLRSQASSLKPQVSSLKPNFSIFPVKNRTSSCYLERVVVLVGD
jgi:hypothetical protein